MEWQEEDALPGKRKAAAASSPVKKRRTGGLTASALHVPHPPFPVVPLSACPPFPPSGSAQPSSSSYSLPAFKRDLHAFLKSVTGSELAAAVQGVHNGADRQDESTLRYVTQALDQWTAGLSDSLAVDGKTQEEEGTTAAAAAAGDDAASSSLPLYSHLAAALSSTLQQFRQYAETLPRSLEPSVPTPSLSVAAVSASSSNLPALLHSGYSSLSISSDVMLGQLRLLQEELERRRAARQQASSRINRQVLAGGDEAEDGDEADGEAAAGSGRKRREVKKIIKSITASKDAD